MTCAATVAARGSVRNEATTISKAPPPRAGAETAAGAAACPDALGVEPEGAGAAAGAGEEAGVVGGAAAGATGGAAAGAADWDGR